MNIYSTADAPVSEAVLEHARMFAGYAAVTVANITSHANAVHEAAHLRKAMESRAVIEQAKGSSWPATSAPPNRRSTC